MEYLVLTAVGLIVISLNIWVFLFKNPADDALKVRLIEAAGDCAEAEDFVRKELARPNLQRRHVIEAVKQVESMVETMRAKATVAAFLNKTSST